MNSEPNKTVLDGPSQVDDDLTAFDDGPVDARDAECCFSLFVGQKPEYSYVQQRLGVKFSWLIRELLDSSEFRSMVLPPLLLRDNLPHELMDSSPSMALIDWAQNRLPIKRSTRLSLGGARSWAQVLELLLSDSILVSVSPELVAAEIESTLRVRLEHDPLLKVTRSVIGSVDSCSAFEVRGWAADISDKSKPVVLEFFAESTFIGTVLCNEPRADVTDFVGGSGNFGFTFKIAKAHRAAFANGKSIIAVDSISKERVGGTLVVYGDAAQSTDILSETRREIAELRRALDRIEAHLPQIRNKSSIPVVAYGEYWERFYRLSAADLLSQRAQSRDFTYQPLISVVVPAWNSSTQLLKKAIESVLAQSYDHWELVISDDASDSDELRSFIRRFATDSRIRWIENKSRAGIAINTNRAIDAAVGEYIAFLDHDDELSHDALFHVVHQLQERRYRFFYSDEDRIEEDEFGHLVHHTPYFKPDFDPDLLLSQNYICHLVVIEREIAKGVGGLQSGYEGAQDHDFLLRVSERLSDSEILHLHRILYHWRVTTGSVSSTPQFAKSIQQNIVSAVQEHLDRRLAPATVESHDDPLGPGRQFATRIRWSLPALPPTISIIIATRDRLELLRPCIESILRCIHAYAGKTEILIMDNDTVDAATLVYLEQISGLPFVSVTRFRGPFNYSAINNAGARQATGEVLIFLNSDTIVMSEEWCTELVSNAIRPDVGAVGARLLYPDGTIQHAGVILGIEGVAGHECVGESPHDGGYFGRTQLQRGASAVTGACLATRKSVFEEMDGFDEVDLKVAFNDVDYCMKLKKAGYRVVYNPFAVLYHLESKSRGREITQAQQQRHRQEVKSFLKRWSDKEINDRYYNLHFERFARPFERLCPPPEMGWPPEHNSAQNTRSSSV